MDAGVAGKFFGSQRSFARVLARNATYTPMGRNLVFARQTQFGVIMPFNVAAGTITVERFRCRNVFLAAAASPCAASATIRPVRATSEPPTETGTPTTTATGFPIGGNALFFNTFELRFPLLGPNISGVFFHDMGNIYTSFSDISLAYKQKPQCRQLQLRSAGAGFWHPLQDAARPGASRSLIRC